MKKNLLFVLLVFVKQIYGQTSFPMPGADWHYEVENYSFFGPSTYSNKEIKYTHDTLFMGKMVKVLNNVTYYNYCSPSSGSTFFYSSNDSVFFYNSETLNKWQLLYSFGTPAGQSWKFQLQNSSINTVDSITVHVDSVKNSLINSINLKTLYVTYTEKNPSILPYQSIIYERIGDITYLFNFVPNSYGLCDGGQKYEGVLCYSDSTLGLYQPDTAKSCNYIYTAIKSINHFNNLNIYPNPSRTNFLIETTSTDKQTLQIFDVNGKLVLTRYINGAANIDVSNLPEGVYNVSLQNSDGVANKRLVIVR